MIRYGSEDRDNAHRLWIACKRDLLFYVNVFCYGYDPRDVNRPVQPFITYPFQDYALLDLERAMLEGYDTLEEKSRDMGASFCALFACTHRWQFFDYQSFLFVSENENKVDKSDDPDSLFWKLDYNLKYQPKWLRPHFDRKKLHFGNLDNNSVIDGTATTDDVSRGGRRTGIFFDEFPTLGKRKGDETLKASRDATRCRIFNGTPKGTNTTFYTLKKKGKINVLTFHWSLHPEKSKGMYTTIDKKIVVLDTSYQFPDEYKFRIDDERKLRSPWYDEQCDRAATDAEIAQELDIDYLGSGYRFFNEETVSHALEAACEPYRTGELLFDPDTLEPTGFMDSPDGRLKLWIDIDSREYPPQDRSYAIAGDIATGTGASNSVLTVGDKSQNEQVAEFADPNTMPHDLAKYAIALAKWFNEAFMIWEANGPGRIFGNTVIDLSYGNVYYKVRDESITKPVSDVPGWYSTKETKYALMGEYNRSLKSSDIIIRSDVAIEECREYVFMPNGSVQHVKSINSEDPSGANDNHGDRVISCALLNKALKGNQRFVGDEKAKEPPVGSWAHRWQEYQNNLQAKERW